MEQKPIPPEYPLSFIKNCVMARRILWTYHVNMRMAGRNVTRKMVLDSIERYEIIEAYPEDKYFPSYLVHSQYDEKVFHVLFAADVENKNVRVVTAYYPNPDRWNEDFKRRRLK